MPPRTALITALNGLRRMPVAQMGPEEIAAERAFIYPDTVPYRWILGRVDPGADISTTTVPARDGHPLPLRIYRPAAGADAPTRPVVVFFHGGGWVVGNPANYDQICASICVGVEAVVVSVDYRLAPEHPAPQAVEDCLDAVDWVVERADEQGWDGARVAICGDSAGGNLAAVVAQVRRDQGRPPLRAQALIYPWTDLTMASPSVAEHANVGILTKSDMDAYRDHYCPEGTDITDPIVSPLFGRLSGLPPTLVQTADLDPIRDDGLRYAEALRECRVHVSITNYPGVPHGFASMPGATRHVRTQRRELVAFLRALLGPVGSPEHH